MTESKRKGRVEKKKSVYHCLANDVTVIIFNESSFQLACLVSSIKIQSNSTSVRKNIIAWLDQRIPQQNSDTK